MPDQPHVVILGAGFGGIGTLKRLNDANLKITIVDKHDYHTFQPLLYQVATDELAPGEVGFPIRELLHGRKNVSFHQASIESVDLARKEVVGKASAQYLTLLGSGYGRGGEFLSHAGSGPTCDPALYNGRRGPAQETRSRASKPLTRTWLSSTRALYLLRGRRRPDRCRGVRCAVGAASCRPGKGLPGSAGGQSESAALRTLAESADGVRAQAPSLRQKSAGGTRGGSAHWHWRDQSLVRPVSIYQPEQRSRRQR